MIRFGPMSITLLLCAGQGIVLAGLLLRARRNRAANRWLALLILAVAALITPFIIGYAGFYDRWPRLSFAPFSLTLAFGPLVYLYTLSLVDAPPARVWPHFMPVLVQFLADALVFPFPLETKNWWNTVAHSPLISPVFEAGTIVSLGLYGLAAWRRYRGYRRWLDDNRTDGVDVDPSWIRNFLIALMVVAVIWLGFIIAKRIDPGRDYFDQFLLYVTFSALVLYLGIAGWRHAETAFPHVSRARVPEVAAGVEKGRDWVVQGQEWVRMIDSGAHWRNPELTLAVLARALGTNTAYLSRALGAASGENFNTLINRRRVAEVQRLLAAGDARDLMALAFEAGFNSKASFNRAFADLAGMSPSAWRLKSRKSPAI
ncbi:AraC family transcriptional regulator [Polymorphobacter multimanifer]|uniref:AraC-like DNA-binding protein n=1 Tax=Polymorphobacter multimanifer TaxID=1070431 RepID=A0A841L2G9_9SPHN|nr:helix-turn-helix domain-containing protein [Polymorphobacter multimanifer]MBB6227009.1 AraC-like DNA-binding protein [Polymorphobacter multimanifer]GGI78129.1 AraC family transcriptional regulator [Polymorphobacter multimanifer]